MSDHLRSSHFQYHGEHWFRILHVRHHGLLLKDLFNAQTSRPNCERDDLSSTPEQLRPKAKYTSEKEQF